MAARLREQGVAADRVILDEKSLSTLDNVQAAARGVRAGRHPYVLACSDAYHLPRIRLLLALHGVRCRSGAGRARPPVGHALAMLAREALAIPHSVVRMMARRARRRS